MKKLKDLAFNNTFYKLGEPFYSEVRPQGIKNPSLVSASISTAQLLGLDKDELNSEYFTQVFSGNAIHDAFNPVAAVYAGHQFGVYVPRLGDGRALLLGEVETEQGNWDLNLKGSGLTPYSRQGDGKAVLRSSIREYLCSEAMAGLGIPTTRALCLIRGEDKVYRETIEPSATIVRVAESHIRFGSFEYFCHTKQIEALRRLADYIIDKHYPDLKQAYNPYLAFFAEVVKRTAELMAMWQAVGFSHGVMNTDNMSVLGLTIDYGPFGFLDDFNPGFICNHSDYNGRYAFNQQPQIGLWNCNAFAYALSPLIDNDNALREILQSYEGYFVKEYAKRMRNKLGLQKEHETDQQLLLDMFELMAEDHVDFTIFFRRLCEYNSNEEVTSENNAPIRDLFIQREKFDTWTEQYNKRLTTESLEQSTRRNNMRVINPKYILRNYLAQNAITKAQEDRDFSEVNKLLDILSRPFDEQPEHEEYAGFPPDWGKKLEISCSS